MAIELLPEVIRANYEVHEWKHACAILKNDFPAEWNDIIDVLTRFRWKRSWVSVGDLPPQILIQREAIIRSMQWRGFFV